MQANTIRFPAGFWILFAMMATIMTGVSYFQGSLVLHLIHSFQLSPPSAYKFYSIYIAFLYVLAVFGGVVSARILTQSHAVFIGIFLLALGMLLTATPEKIGFHIGLVVFAVGYGLSYPNAFLLLGNLYKLDNIHRDSAFTLAYMGLNVGALTGFLIAGRAIQASYFSETAVAISVLIFFMLFLLLIKRAAFHVRGTIKVKQVIVFMAFLMLIGFLCLQHAEHVQSYLSLFCFLVLCAFFLVSLSTFKKNKNGSKKMLLLSILIIITIVFWSAYRLQNSMLLLFIEHHVNLTFSGHLLSPPMLLALNPIFVMSLGLLINALIPHIHKKIAVTPANKIFCGLVSITVAFSCLWVGNKVAYQVSLGWVVAFFFFISLGEIILAPTTYSMVGRLSEPKYQGFFIGGIRATMSIASLFAGSIAASLGNISTAGSPHEQAQYSHAFMIVIVGLSIAVLLSLISINLYRRWGS